MGKAICGSSGAWPRSKKAVPPDTGMALIIPKSMCLVLTIGSNEEDSGLQGWAERWQTVLSGEVLIHDLGPGAFLGGPKVERYYRDILGSAKCLGGEI